ncbi:MAG: hypothetical protein QOJ65_1384 [Fimbriimonadaceae bacterium]|jgi:hypothetical protein|nr:hypothetical protein [Fimbriimonadaceae bacterium]
MVFKRPATYAILAAIAFVLFMFGLRLQTLQFGQVFPEHAKEDLAEISGLKHQVSQLEERRKQQDIALQKAAELEAESTRLRAELASLKNRGPEIQYVEVVVPRMSELTLPTKDSKATPVKDTASNVVHRGDSQAIVRAVFGKPTSVSNFGSEEVWYFGEYSKSVRFDSGGRVKDWSEMPVEP